MPMVDGSLPKLDASQKDVVGKCVPEVLRIMERLEKSDILHHDGRVSGGKRGHTHTTRGWV